MKSYMRYSVIVASLMLGVTLNATGLSDSVATKEATALKSGTVAAEASAKAAVEEANSKELFLSKMKSQRFVDDAQNDKASQINRHVTTELTHHKKASEQTPEELKDGFKQTLLALQALQADDISTAQEALKSAAAAFDKALKADPSLDLIPVADGVRVDSFNADAASVKKMIKTVKKLLERYDTQAARAIMLPMKDEMVLSTTYLPMKIYPDAMKEAQKALQSNNVARALEMMQGALDAIVVKTVTVPIALLSAQDLINVASQLDSSKKKEAEHLLDIASDELEKAVLLGYIKKYEDEYKTIKEEIREVQKEIRGKNRVEKFYDRLKGRFHELMQKIRSEVTTQ